MSLLEIIKCCTLVLMTSTYVHCQGNKIVFPDEIPDLIEKLKIDDRIRTRFNFREPQTSCFTQEGIQGECLPLQQCPELLDYVQNRGIRTNRDVTFLRGRICRLFFNSVNLCCVRENQPVISPPDSFRITTRPERKVPSVDECGFTSARRITDGIEIAPGSHPWLAAIGYPRDDDSFRVLCGGTLITKRHVLTAAHCFIRQPGIRELSHVRLGEHNLRSSEGERVPPITLKIQSKKNPGYNTVSHVNDIELVVLEREVDFNQFVRPICLPLGFQTRNFENSQMTIVGWGDTFHRSFRGSDIPLAANISVIPKPECREAYVNEPQVPLDETQFCAGRGSKDACQGDSGGPLIYQDLQEHRRYFLLGIVSFGVGCANPDFPGVYTYIPEFIKWINDNL